MSAPAIEAVDLVKRFDDFTAVDGVSFSVPAGSVFSMLGPNGAGKTTTVRMMTTLSIPTSGTARVAGFDVVADPDAVRHRMGLTAQSATVDELLTGRENLRLIGDLYGLDRRVVKSSIEELLERFSLSEAGNKVVKDYSGGMRRRLDLAASLIATPPVLFLDEPTTGLDPRSRVELWGVLRDLVRDGTTLFLTTQYLDEADQLADNIVVVDHGRIIAQGTPLELKDQSGAASLVITVSRPGEVDRAAELVRSEVGEHPRRPRRPAHHRARRGGGCAHPHRRPARRGRHRPRRHRPATAQPRRRLPQPHRPPGRGRGRGRPGVVPRRAEDGGGPMTSTTVTHFQATHPDERGATGTRQIGALIRRNLTHIKRQPEMLTDVTIQPVMFVLLFAFVFGGSINIPGVDYKEWLLPGIMAQTMAFSSFVVAIGLNNDLGKGIVDRFRSLPIGRGAVVVARSVSSLIHSSLGIVVMSVTGLFIGWGINNGWVLGLVGYGLLVLFGFMMIWIGILVGSSLRSVEAVQGVMFVTIFPITFLSNAFARPEGMPPVLRFLAEWNPISALVQALRELWGNEGLPGAARRGAAAAVPRHRDADLDHRAVRHPGAAGDPGLRAPHHRLRAGTGAGLGWGP